MQYPERQLVLFDALEDAAFRRMHDMNGPVTLKHLELEVVKFGMIFTMNLNLPKSTCFYLPVIMN